MYVYNLNTLRTVASMKWVFGNAIDFLSLVCGDPSPELLIIEIAPAKQMRFVWDMDLNIMSATCRISDLGFNVTAETQ